MPKAQITATLMPPVPTLTEASRALATMDILEMVSHALMLTNALTDLTTAMSTLHAATP